MNIKSISKRVVSFALVLAMALSVSGISNYSTADAANLNKLTLKVGEKQKLVVKSGPYGLTVVSWKKVKWKSSNKKVATVSKKGVVKAIKKGKATISAKYGKKTLKCKLTVKANKKAAATAKPSTSINSQTQVDPNVISNTELAANLKVQALVTPDKQVLFAIVNNNKSVVKSYTINYQMKTSAGAVVDTGTENGHMINPGETQYKVAYIGTNYEQIDVNASLVSVTANNSVNYIDITKSVTVSAAPKLDGGLSVTIVNGHSSSASIYVDIIFYDAAGNIVGVDDQFHYPSAGETRMRDVTGPYIYDEHYNRVPTYSSYKIFYSAYAW